MLQRPGTLLEGELHRCSLSMRNSGASPLHNVRMIVSHPDVHCPVTDENLDADVATALSGNIDTPYCLHSHASRQDIMLTMPLNGEYMRSRESSGLQVADCALGQSTSNRQYRWLQIFPYATPLQHAWVC